LRAEMIRIVSEASRRQWQTTKTRSDQLMPSSV
jgi:hypothetical protein